MTKQSHIEQLIQNLCPNGVEMTTLGALGVFENIGVDKKIVPGEKDVTLLNFMDICRHKYIDASVPTMVVTASDKKILQCNVLKDDIFITPSSETIDEIGFASVIMEDLPNVVYSYHIMRYRMSHPNTTTAKYIRYLFEAPIIRTQILKGAKGLTRFGLSKYQFAELEIPLPPFEIQEEIVRTLDTFSKLIDNIDTEIQERQRQFDLLREVSFSSLKKQCKERKPLNEVLNYEQPGKYIVSSTNYDNSYPTPVLTAGQSFILGYTDETEGIYKASKKNPTIIFDDFTTSFHWVDFDFKVKSSAMKMLRLHKDANAVYRYVYYAMLGIDYTPAEHSRQWISRYSTFEIPLPPIEEQQAIAAKLDTIEAFIANLNEERTLRQQQYEYYRAKLISLLK